MTIVHFGLCDWTNFKINKYKDNLLIKRIIYKKLIKNVITNLFFCL